MISLEKVDLEKRANGQCSTVSSATGNRGQVLRIHLSPPAQARAKPSAPTHPQPPDPGVSRGTFSPLNWHLTPAGTAPPQQMLLDTLSLFSGYFWDVFVMDGHLDVPGGSPAGIQGAKLGGQARAWQFLASSTPAVHQVGCSASASLLVCPPLSFLG